jgi:hypothetical protein
MSLGPARVVKDGKAYNYSRMVAELLTCDTCGTVFMTHVATGFGAVLMEDDNREMCAGCQEIVSNLQTAESQVGPWN